MPSPYKTNCFEYNKIGCKSRRDCVDRCNIEWALIHCNNSLPEYTISDKHNDKDKFGEPCNDNNKEFCENKYKSPDCFNEYYKIKLISEKSIMKGGWRQPIEVSPRRRHVMTYISLERSRRVEQLCPLGQSDPRLDGDARRRQSEIFFANFLNLKVPL